MNTKLAQTEPEQIKKEEPVRMSGILVHPTSFPSPYGIGDLGPGAYDFIDFLAGSGQTLWQVLPLGPTGFGDSPYQGFSAFAGQPLIISPDLLIKANLLTKQDIEEEGPQNFDPRRVDYGPAIEFKTKLLKKAWRSFTHTPDRCDQGTKGLHDQVYQKDRKDQKYHKDHHLVQGRLIIQAFLQTVHALGGCRHDHDSGTLSGRYIARLLVKLRDRNCQNKIMFQTVITARTLALEAADHLV